MALTKYLFTSAQAQSYIRAGLDPAGSWLREAGNTAFKKGKKLRESGAANRKIAQTSKDASAASDANSNANGDYMLSGFASAGGAASAGLGFVLKAIGKFAGDAFFQEMYLNPDNLKMSYKIPTKIHETVGGVILNHWRTDLPKISMSGTIGWIRQESILNSAVDNAAKALVAGNNVGDAVSDSFSGFTGGGLNTLSKIQRFREESRNLVNSPRKFLEKLRGTALAPMYFIHPISGLEMYNLKKIIVFTKQYPEGVGLEGFYENFDVTETGKDAQTIKYSFNFVAFNLAPVTLTDRLGQFLAPFLGTVYEVASGIGTAVNSVGKVPGQITGLLK